MHLKWVEIKISKRAMSLRKTQKTKVKRVLKPKVTNRDNKIQNNRIKATEIIANLIVDVKKQATATSYRTSNKIFKTTEMEVLKAT